MILITILLLTLIILMVATVGALAMGGAAVIIVFGDVIVCMIFIGLLVKRLFKRRKK